MQHMTCRVLWPINGLFSLVFSLKRSKLVSVDIRIDGFIRLQPFVVENALHKRWKLALIAVGFNYQINL